MSFLADLYGDFDNDESELRYWEEVLEMNSNEEELEEQQGKLIVFWLTMSPF